MNLVVTVPASFWPQWIAEGDPAGVPASGTEWGFYLGGTQPKITRGERLYIVARGKLRGYSPVTRVTFHEGRWVICREGGAVAVTIDQQIKGFQGWRYVWWKPEDEKPFPNWRDS